MVKITFYVLIFCISFKGNTQNISKEKLDTICTEVREVIGDDWFLTQTELGFKVTFCRSCHTHYIDSYNSGVETLDLYFGVSRDLFFSLDRIDSVCYYTTVSNPPHPFYENDSIRNLALLKTYKANGILSFEVRIEEKWDRKRFQEVAVKNESLRKEILKEPLYKTSMDIFSDYRFWLPDDYLKSRTAKYDFYFERLPYTSERHNYSIFIIQDKPYYFCSPLYIDKNDNISNELEDERQRTLKIIAKALGILDFKVIN